MEPWRALRPVGREAGPRLLLALFGLWFYFWRGRIVLWTVRSLLRQLRFQRSSPWHPRTCPTVLTGMTAVVTGANSGLGKQVALELVRRGARVVLACRDLTRGQEALDDIRAATGCGPQRLLLREVDLSSLASVRAFAARLLAELPEIHLLVNNAGIPGLPARTPDGLNVTLATNYLGPFLLTNLLLSVTANSVDPGVVVTNITKNLSRTWRLSFQLLRPLFKSPAQGARSILYCCLAQEVEGVTGKYFANDCTLQLPAAPACDPALARSIWSISCRLTGLGPTPS
ncbi:retinol dehydrogenase 14-like isoform X4 [Ornithorhynchus anatinus]|uniref:retinol dehydrogenase 14-like isoform X4 n=1 Tax=Ornithorhynchus anatinus TaxID=9258 RepID=UPI0010A7EFEE|nr:retinol dehydrogenase 14-like isoform X4 [Ornithorhynchus anatinus]